MALLGKCSKSNSRVYLKNNTEVTERLRERETFSQAPRLPGVQVTLHYKFNTKKYTLSK